MDRIYLVFGMTGEYSDAREWPVVSYASREAANNRATLLNELLGECKGRIINHGLQDKVLKMIRDHAHGDPRCSIDYTGTEYGVEEIPFINL